MYRIVHSDSEQRLQLYFGRNILTQHDIAPLAAEHLRRFAETHAGAELDWRGGTVRTLAPHRGLPCLWQATAPHIGLAA
jgi:hypothetical protein